MSDKASQKDILLSSLTRLGLYYKVYEDLSPNKFIALLWTLPKQEFVHKYSCFFVLRPQISILTRAAINKLNIEKTNGLWREMD